MKANVIMLRAIQTGPFGELLDELNLSLLVSTYQRGTVLGMSWDGARLRTEQWPFSRPMGIARQGSMLAIATRNEVELLREEPTLRSHEVDARFSPLHTFRTGSILAHDLAFAGEQAWVVNTFFSCLATVSDEFSFVPRWRPRCVSALRPDDRCHLNGVAVIDDAPRFVTALGATDEPEGWRPAKDHGGVLFDVASGEVALAELCMPHSPRWHDGRLWMLESGRGGLGVVDLLSGRVTEVMRLPGFTRGLGFAGRYAFVGLSEVRETAFDGLPITAAGSERSCGVWAIDTRSGELIASLRLEGDVHELFEVFVLDGVRRAELVTHGSEVLDEGFVLPSIPWALVPDKLAATD